MLRTPQSGLPAPPVSLLCPIPGCFVSFFPTLTQLLAGGCPTLSRRETGAGRRTIPGLRDSLWSESQVHHLQKPASPSPGGLERLLAVASLLPAALGLLILLDPLQRHGLWQLLLHLVGLDLNVGFLLKAPV